MEKYIASFLVAAIVRAQEDLLAHRHQMLCRDVEQQMEFMDRVVCSICLKYHLPDPLGMYKIPVMVHSVIQ